MQIANNLTPAKPGGKTEVLLDMGIEAGLGALAFVVLFSMFVLLPSRMRKSNRQQST